MIDMNLEERQISIQYTVSLTQIRRKMYEYNILAGHIISEPLGGTDLKIEHRTLI